MSCCCGGRSSSGCTTPQRDLHDRLRTSSPSTSFSTPTRSDHNYTSSTSFIQRLLSTSSSDTITTVDCRKTENRRHLLAYLDFIFTLSVLPLCSGCAFDPLRILQFRQLEASQVPTPSSDLWFLFRLRSPCFPYCCTYGEFLLLRFLLCNARSVSTHNHGSNCIWPRLHPLRFRNHAWESSLQ